MSANKYTVEVTREGDAWIADVTNLVGAHTYSRSYAALRREVDEVIRLVDDLDDDVLFDVEYTFSDFDDDFVKLSEIGDRRIELEDQNRELGVSMVNSILAMKERYSVRDIAAALYLTPGRVSQIVSRNAIENVTQSGRNAGARAAMIAAKNVGLNAALHASQNAGVVAARNAVKAAKTPPSARDYQQRAIAEGRRIGAEQAIRRIRNERHIADTE